MIYMLFNFRRMILKQESEPLMVRRMVPMCSAQYERIFNTTRIPGQKVDRLVNVKNINLRLISMLRGAPILYNKIKLLLLTKGLYIWTTPLT